MTRLDYTHVAFLLDRSGSMQSVAEQTVSGINEFLREQREQTGACTFTLVQFDDEDPQEVVYDMQPIAEAAPLTAATFIPRGSTPLLDAMGMLIESTGARLAAMDEPDRPGAVILVIMTDGMENASRRFSSDQVFEMIRHQREVYQWQVMFLGANQDAIAQAGRLGVDPGASLTYAANDDGVRHAMASSSHHVAHFRRRAAHGAVAEVAFTDEDRAEQAEAGSRTASAGDAGGATARVIRPRRERR